MKELRIVEIKRSDIKSPQLQRVAHAETPISKYYVAIYKFKEVGVVHIGVQEPPEPVFIYYLFVMSQFRSLGIGRKLVEAVEILAFDRGNTLLELEPGQIDLDFPVSQVEAWYMRRGYQPTPKDPRIFQKQLDPNTRPGSEYPRFYRS